MNREELQSLLESIRPFGAARAEAHAQWTSVAKRLENLTPLDETARAEAHARWDSIAKPLGSLGLLETVVEDVAALTGTAEVMLAPRAVYVFCGDHGVVDQGVTQCGREVTGLVARQIAAGRTAVCCMAELAYCRVVPVDMGMADFAPCRDVRSYRVGNGTADFTLGPAMSREQAERAVVSGIYLAVLEALRGTCLLAAGEMGIGNTTSAAAVASVLLGCPPEALCGRGAGLSEEGLARKRAAVRRGIEVNQPDTADPLDVLAKLGGFELAGMCGLFLGGALMRVPVLIDGFLSAAAALCAQRLFPRSAEAMLASHVSAEAGGALLLEALGKSPLITAGLRLGEGTGAVAAIPLLDLALSVYQRAYRFQEGGITPYTPQ